jgi:DNA topoisomerase IB
VCVPRLRRSNVRAPGYARRRRGRGFVYLDAEGRPLQDADVLARCEALVIPPAWTDVWICPWPNGHIQALGTDAAGRRQYRYHDVWRRQRDEAKHERVLDFAERLPGMRKRLCDELAGEGLSRTRVLATAVRLLDLGFFRIGSETYAEENGTFGLATIRKDQVTIEQGVVIFDYLAKGSKQREQSVADEDVLAVVRALKRRRGGGEELLAYRDGRGWHDVRSDDINRYLRQLAAFDCSAKDFRTWHATVLMAVALAVSPGGGTSESARKRAVARAVRGVSQYLGNTPAVARTSYIDPRILDLYDDGVTVAPTLEHLGEDGRLGQLATQGAVEEAVLALLREA